MQLSRNLFKIRFVCLGFFLIILMSGVCGQPAQANWYDGDDLGYLDVVTVNGTLYEDLDSREIVFYARDLDDQNGEVEITGILESERKDLKPSDLKVQISLNGGKSWHDATGDRRWSYTFRPTLERVYDLSIQVVRRDSTIDSIDLSNPYFALGDFLLKVASDEIGEAGTIANNSQGAISGLPQILIDELPAGVLNDANELVVQLQGFSVDVATRTVSRGSVVYTPATPLDVTFGPATLTFAGVEFTTSSAAIDGSINLAGLGLPVSDLPFAGLYLGTDSIAGDIDLIGEIGTRTITIMEGEYGFGLKLNDLTVNVDTRKDLAKMVSLESFGGSVLFGSGFNNLEIPDLELLAGNAISWGKNSATEAQGSLARLTLPGGVFSLGDLGGSLNLAEQSLSIGGTIFLPPSMGSASLSIPVDQPLILSVADGLTTSGPLVFNPAELPAIPLASIDTTLTALSLDLSGGNISGTLAGDLNFNQFGGLQIAVSAEIDETGLQELRIDTGNLDESFDLAGFATLRLENVETGYKDDKFYVELDGSITPTHDLFAEYRDKVEKVSFTGLRVFKSGLEFANDLDGWHEADGVSFGINSAQLLLKEYGLGVYHGALWFGLKGQATYLDNEISLTAKIFQDGTSEISDFGFEGLYFALGDFSLRTSVEVIAGKISGSGFINAGFLSDYLPDDIKDPLTGEVNVEFVDLGVDLENRTITSGTVKLKFKEPLTPDFGFFSAAIRSLSFGFDGASVDGDFSLTKLGDLDIPSPPTGISFANIELSPAGFIGKASYQAGRTPVKIPVLTGEYGIDLLLSELTVAVDTTEADLLDKIRLTALDGAIELGSGYGMRQPVTQLRMLADGGITWGAATLEGLSKEAREEARLLQSSLSFTIPGTSFKVDKLNGRLYLNDKKMEVWGEVKLPADLGGASIGVTRENALVLSAAGVSTTGEVDVDLGTLGSGFKLAGFGADLTAFSFGVTANTVSGSIAGDIRLSMFDNLPIGVSVVLGNTGISELTVTADEIGEAFIFADFATLTLRSIGGGYVDGAFFVDLDGSLTLENSAISDLPQSFDFRELRIYHDALALADAALGMHDIPGATITLNDSLAMFLSQYGIGVTDNRFWIALVGGITVADQDVTATAKLYHDGEFELVDFGADNLTIAIGDFTLRSSIAFSNEAGFEAEGGLHLGALMDSIPADFKNSLGELPVTITDVVFDLSDLSNPRFVSGAIVFAPGRSIPINTEFFNASVTGFEVGVAGGSPYGKVMGGTISFNAVGVLPALEGVSITDLGLAGGGLQGTVNWSGSQTVHVFEDDNYGIDTTLTALAIGFDSTASAIDDMFVLEDLGGNLAFGRGYNTTMAPAIDFADGAYGFNAGVASKLTLPGTGVELRNVSGSFDFEARTVTVGGLIAIPYEETEIAFAVDELTFSASGIAGSAALDGDVDLSESLGFSALLTEAAIAFDGFAISEGSLGMDLTLEKFFNLGLTAHLALDNDGVSEWGLGGETDENFTADAGFAELTVSNLGAGYESADGGLYFSMDTDIAMNADAVLSALPDDLTLSGIEVYATSVNIDAASMSSSFSGQTASLGGLDLTLTKLGVGYGSEKFYLEAGGNINIADLCEAGAEVKLYEDLTYDLDAIEIAFTNPALSFDGYLAMYDNDPVYGTGFGAALDVIVAGTIPVAGALQVGRVDEDTSSFMYWRVEMKAGTMIPLAPLPLNIYGLGGGIAYHMQVNASPGSVEFTPNGAAGLALTALVDMGTTDNGTSWFGKFGLTIEPADMRVVLTGDSWMMEGRNPTVDPHLAVVLELGGSPTIFHLAASIHVTKEAGGMDMVDVNGEVDVLFAANDWHVYFGSKEQPLSVTVLHYLGGEGYLQIDRSGLAMGVRKEFDLEGSAWIFYGRLYGGGEIDVAAGIQPFYVDARGKVWVGLEAGVKVSGTKYEIISAYAELQGRFRAPPVYIGLHGEARYSFLMGTIKGTWDMTFTYPDDPPEGAGDGGIETVPLLAYSTPEQGATDVDRFTSLNIKTNVPINDPFQYEGDDWYMLTVDEYVDRERVVDSIDVSSMSESNLGVLGGLNSSLEVQYNPDQIYPPGQPITYEARLSLREWNYDTFSLGSIISQETVEVTFDTSNDDPSFRERVYEVYPGRSTTPVYGDTDIYIISKAIQDGVQWSWSFPFEKLSFQVVDATGERVAGVIRGNLVTYDGQEGSKRFLIQFKPDRPLQPVRMVQNNATGVKAPAIKLDDGSYQNPFTYVMEEAEATEYVATAVVAGSNLQADTTRTVASQTTSSRNPSAAARVAAGQSALGVTTSQRGPRGRRSRGRRDTPVQVEAVANTDEFRTGVQVGDFATSVQAGDFTITPTYRWFWDGDYTIQVVNNVGVAERVFVSGFTLEVPQEGEDVHAYGSTAEVVSESISNPHFYINYTVDQEAFGQDMITARQDIVETGVIDLFWENMEREPTRVPVSVVDLGGSWGKGAETRVEWREVPVCGQFDSPQDIGTEASGMFPSDWSNVRMLPRKIQWVIYMQAMQGCQSLEAEIAILEQQLDAYREEAFKRHSVADFRSLEFRFSTAAPINWSEVDMSIHVNPEFAGEEGAWTYSAWVLQGIKWASSHTFNTGEYIVRSEAGSLDHRLELVPNGGAFDGQVLVGYLQYFRTERLSLTRFGHVNIRDRGLQNSNVVNEDGREFSIQASSQRLYESGPITHLESTRPASSSHRDGLSYEGQGYSDGSN
jgi:hypothetical protein